MEKNGVLDHDLISRDKGADKWVIENNFGSNIRDSLE